MYAAHVHSGDAQDGVFERLHLKAQAGLRPVGRLVVFNEAHDHRFQRTRRVIGRGLAGMKQCIQRGRIGKGISPKGREPGI